MVGYAKKLNDIEELIYRNEALCKSIVAHAMDFYGIEQSELDDHTKEAEKTNRQADKISVSQTLKHFVRDWADEGMKEREDAFPCVLSMLKGLGLDSAGNGRPVKVLLPGSGLGRLGHEVAELGQSSITSPRCDLISAHIFSGYEVTVNEWSMYMNVAYRYLEAHTDPHSISMYPFIDGMSHHASTSDMMREVTSPNVRPNPSVLLVEGDFVSAFSGKDVEFDIIITHFFIDTARNLMFYFDTIQRLLKPGGHWINFGPLLYGSGPFVQLSLDEIVMVVEDMGFQFEDIDDSCGDLTFSEKKVRGKEAEYGFNGKALTKNAYEAQAWMARKI